MLQQDKPDDYVIATGETHSVREFAEKVFSKLELDYLSMLLLIRDISGQRRLMFYWEMRPKPKKPWAGNRRLPLINSST